MNALILDKDELTWEAVGYFKEFEKEWKFYDYSYIEKNMFTINDFDLVIVDISDSKNETIYKSILKDDKNKKIIVLSESLERCNDNDCNYCEKHNSIRRLMKPIELTSLYNLITSFESRCDFFDTFENISNLIESIIKRFSSLIYDTETKEVGINRNVPSSIHTQEFLSFVNILEQNSVCFVVINETRIKIR